MSYEFKVGDVGLLRDGVTKYEIIAIVAGMTRPIIVRKNNYEEIVQRYPDGRVAKHMDSRTDLMPPMKIVYDLYFDVIRKDRAKESPIAYTYVFDNIESAKKKFDYYNNIKNEYANVTLTPREVQQ